MKCPKCKEKMDLRSQGITDYKWYHDYFCDVCKIAKLQVKEDIRTWNTETTVEDRHHQNHQK